MPIATKLRTVNIVSVAKTARTKTPNPIATKAMVRLMGLPAGFCRPPLPDVPARILKAMEEIIERFELRSKYGLN